MRWIPLLLLVLALGLGGCASNSEFMQHDTMYKNWDHLKFSWFGSENPEPNDVANSQEQGWWGIPVPASGKD